MTVPADYLSWNGFGDRKIIGDVYSERGEWQIQRYNCGNARLIINIRSFIMIPVAIYIYASVPPFGIFKRRAYSKSDVAVTGNVISGEKTDDFSYLKWQNGLFQAAAFVIRWLQTEQLCLQYLWSFRK